MTNSELLDALLSDMETALQVTSVPTHHKKNAERLRTAVVEWIQCIKEVKGGVSHERARQYVHVRFDGNKRNVICKDVYSYTIKKSYVDAGMLPTNRVILQCMDAKG